MMSIVIGVPCGVIRAPSNGKLVSIRYYAMMSIVIGVPCGVIRAPSNGKLVVMLRIML